MVDKFTDSLNKECIGLDMLCCFLEGVIHNDYLELKMLWVEVKDTVTDSEMSSCNYVVYT